MKLNFIIPLLLAGCFSAAGEMDEKELKALKKETEIGGVRSNTIKNKKREKIETLEIETYRNEDFQTGFRIYAVVEVQDKEKNSYLVEFAGNQREVDSDFLGEEYWTLEMPWGDFEKLKVTAYAIHYGIMDDDEETFILLAEDYDDVDSMEELKARTTTPFPGKTEMSYYYMYDDETEGADESIPQDVKKLNVNYPPEKKAE